MFFEENKRHWEERLNNPVNNNPQAGKVLIEVAACHPLFEGDKPGEEFKSRLDKAIELYKKEIEKGNDPHIYVPGSTHYITKDGVDQVDKIPLAEAGKAYLLEFGNIPEEKIRANDANQKYQGDRGVYNSGDECFVASKIYEDEHFDRLISIVSPVQVFRKGLFYNEFGIQPTMCTVPLDKTAHNYVGEAFWSLFVTAFIDHTWQGEESFLATLTRKERFHGYQFSETEKNTLENSRIILPEEILKIKARMMEQYKNAQKEMDYKITIPFARTLIDLSDDPETYLQSATTAIEIAKAENEKGRKATLCCKDKVLKDVLSRVIENYNVEDIEVVCAKDAIQEYKDNKYGRLYKVCNPDEAFEYSIGAIEKGAIPLVTTIQHPSDNFVEHTFRLFDRIIGRDVINKAFESKELSHTKIETPEAPVDNVAPETHCREER